MKTKTVSETSSQEEISLLQQLAYRYRNEQFIYDGVNDEARTNNLLAVEALKAAGIKLNRRFNKYYAICLGGSRIKGYNTSDSDIDLTIVGADTTDDYSYAYRAVEHELDKRGVTNRLCGGMGVITGMLEVKTDPREFIATVDHQPHELIVLFGSFPYSNPNLKLAQLAALETTARCPLAEDVWQSVAWQYNKFYLGDYEHIVDKVSERCSIETDTVRRVFTKRLFKERYAAFGISDFERLLNDLRNWQEKNRRELRKYQMYSVHRKVLKLLDDEWADI